LDAAFPLFGLSSAAPRKDYNMYWVVAESKLLRSPYQDYIFFLHLQQIVCL
jgi:hypothetical protein